jgi:hypothetical protein
VKDLPRASSSALGSECYRQSSVFSSPSKNEIWPGLFSSDHSSANNGHHSFGWLSHFSNNLLAIKQGITFVRFEHSQDVPI